MTIKRIFTKSDSQESLENSKNYIICKPLNDGKGGEMVFELKNLLNTSISIQKSYRELEQFFERYKSILPPNLDKTPPKRKFLVSEQKIIEKRKNWVEAIINYLINKYFENSDIQLFFGPLINLFDENYIYLGNSEKRSIKPSHFDYLKTIGQGSFGRVYMVRHNFDGEIYAMKVLVKEQIKRRNEVKHVMAEKNVLLKNINHPFLVSLHYSFQTKNKLYFVLDFLNGGELFFHLQKERSFCESKARFYSAEIASAIGYLHEQNIIYRDLKPENILLDRHGHVVLTDFGLCKEGIKSKDTTNTFCGTPEYLAPEVIEKKPYDRTVDWWCLGCVLFEMLFGLPPFYSKNQQEMYQKIINQQLIIPSNISLSTKNFLQRILRKNRFERLGARNFDEICFHPFFALIDWEKLNKREIRAPFIPKIRSETDTINIARTFTDIEPNPVSKAIKKKYA
uniref:Uncharacterized protein n=1 Tax=Meloidogyne incognita TaxID=6306 RepID=A0A914KT89_MELIC